MVSRLISAPNVWDGDRLHFLSHYVGKVGGDAFQQGKGKIPKIGLLTLFLLLKSALLFALRQSHLISSNIASSLLVFLCCGMMDWVYWESLWSGTVGYLSNSEWIMFSSRRHWGL